MPVEWNWKFPINGGFNGKIIYKWKMFHCHARLPEGDLNIIG